MTGVQTCALPISEDDLELEPDEDLEVEPDDLEVEPDDLETEPDDFAAEPEDELLPCDTVEVRPCDCEDGRADTDDLEGALAGEVRVTVVLELLTLPLFPSGALFLLFPLLPTLLLFCPKFPLLPSGRLFLLFPLLPLLLVFWSKLPLFPLGRLLVLLPLLLLLRLYPPLLRLSTVRLT